jgi:hypothetical protein
MITYLNTVHEEEYSDSNGNRIFGVLFNYNNDENFKECFIYTYRNKIYVFFNTIIEAMEFLLYGDENIKRAYLDEKDFDYYYDAQYINGKFSDILKWIEKK